MMDEIERKIDYIERVSRLPLTVLLILLLWWSINSQTDLLKHHLANVEKTLIRLTDAIDEINRRER